MVGPAGPGVHMLRAALELAVGEDREAHAPVNHVAVVDADVLVHGRRVEGVRVMGGVRAVNHVDHPRRLPVAAERRRAPSGVHRLATLAPDVALEHVVVVRDAERRPVPHRLAKRPAEHVVLAQVVEDRGPGRLPDQAVAAVALVELVAGEEEQVRIPRQNVVGDRSVREGVVVLAGEPRQPQRPPVRVRADRAAPLVLRLAAVRVPLAEDEPERRRHALVPVGQAERRRPGVRVERGETVGPPFPVVLRQQLDPPVVLLCHWREKRRQLDHEPLVAARVARRVHRPQDRPETAVLVDLEGIPVHRPLAEPVASALALRDLPIEVADDGDVPGDVRGAHDMSEVAQLTSGSGLSRQVELTVLAVGSAFKNQDDPFGCCGVAVGRLRARSSQDQPTADQPCVNANAPREAVAPMIVDPVADADPEPHATVPFAAFHPPAPDRHPEPPPLAGQSMGDQVEVSIAARRLHFGGTVHNPPVLHRIGPERLPEPHPVIGPMPPIDSGACLAPVRLLLSRRGTSDPSGKGHRRCQKSE